MKHRIVTFAVGALLSAVPAFAQEKTIIISESGLPYAEQTWVAYGSGDIEAADITKGWENNKRIVAAAYTTEGWLTVMARRSGYSRQTFTISEQWPEQWIAEKTAQGYAITTFSRSPAQWLVVMSQGSSITRQTVWRNSWQELAPWIREQKGLGYLITGLAFDGVAWTVVMSQGAPYASQGYFWVKTTSELMSRVQRDVWGKGFNVHQIEFGEGNYVVVYGNYTSDDGRFQNLQVNPTDVKGYIKQQWDKQISIAYIGGGLPDASEKPVKESWIAR